MDAALKLAERVIAYKNVRFILEHQNDSLDQLSTYLAKCEVIGGDYIEYRFDSWVNALRSFWNGKTGTSKNPPPFAERKIVQDVLNRREVRP